MKIQSIARSPLSIPLLFASTIFLFLNGCANTVKPFDAVSARRILDLSVENSVRDESGSVYRNAVILVDAPDYGFHYEKAAGTGRADTGEPMTTGHQFTIASVGKTMTAVIILQLWEEGFFGANGLDATMEELEAFPPEVLDALHRIDGIPYGRTVTVRQLLNQTSGLKDVLMDDENGIGEDYPAEFRGYAPHSLNGLVVFDEEKGLNALMNRLGTSTGPKGPVPDNFYLGYTWPQWDYEAWEKDPSDKTAGLLNFYLSGMNETALWKPGEAFHYSDTNYIVLGLLIEKMTGSSLHHELRERIFDPLGMDATYLAYSKDPPTEKWEGKHSDHWGMDIPLVSTGINLSMDWGAGGEVSTVRDLNIFIRAVAERKFFKNESTFQEMLRLPEGIAQPVYAAGILSYPTDNGFIIHHNGAPGSWIEYHSEDNISIVGTVNDIDRIDRFQELRGSIYHALEEAGIKSSTIKTGDSSLAFMVSLQSMPTGTVFVFASSVLVFLSVLIAWPVAFLIKRNKREIRPSAASAARWSAFGITIVNLSYAAAFLIIVSRNPVQLMFGYDSSILPFISLPIAAGVASIGLIVFVVLSWKNGYWNLPNRVHYSLAAAAQAGFLWSLYALHMLPL